jgi:hypothetical protein
MSKLVIVMDGGVIQNLIADGDDIEVCIVDYDVEDVDFERQALIKSEGGKPTPAYVDADPYIQYNSSTVNKLFKEVKDSQSSKFIEVTYKEKDENGVTQIVGQSPESDFINIGFVFERKFYGTRVEYEYDPYVEVVVDHVKKLVR